MAVTLPIDNENRMVNAILEMIRTQDLKVKQKIQLILKQEIEEEERAVSAINGIDTRPYTLEELYGIRQPYNAKRNEYLNDKYGL